VPSAIKEFEVTFGSDIQRNYVVRIYFQSKLIETIVKPTLREAHQQLEEEGYKLQLPSLEN